jgi:hypothetical protein
MIEFEVREKRKNSLLYARLRIPNHVSVCQRQLNLGRHACVRANVLCPIAEAPKEDFVTWTSLELSTLSPMQEGDDKQSNIYLPIPTQLILNSIFTLKVQN